jgi:enoyl-CoA hydratase
MMEAWFDRNDEYPHVAHLRFDFGTLNLLTPSAIDALTAAVNDVPEYVSILIIRGVVDDPDTVGGLTGGLHLDTVKDYDTTEARELIGQLYRTMERIRNLNAVTICGCGEYALGAGLELEMSCDFRVATKDAALGLPEIDVGLVTGIQGGLLIRLVGLQVAKELVFTGETISGERAKALRLVNYAVTADEYEAMLTDLVETLAAKSPRILAWQTDMFRALRSNGVEAGMMSSRETIAMCFGTDDQRDAMEAFLED